MRVTRPSARQAEAAFAAAASAITIWNSTKGVAKAVKARQEYDITVRSDDPIYSDVMTELLQLIPNVKQRDITAGFNRSTIPKSKPLSVHHSGETAHTIRLGGHRVRVVITTSSTTRSSGGETPIDEAFSRYLPRKAIFTAMTIDGRDAVLEWLTDLAGKRRSRDNPPMIHLLTRWGSWDSVCEVAGRSLDSVVLPGDQMERIVDDLALFLSSRDDYDRFGIPWHHGYLFSGMRGTGKTSIARVLASHFNLDLWYMPLSDVPGDTDILMQISQIRSGILLLEDVDVFDAASSRNESDKERSLSLSGLLNALDGVATPPGLITIMTTNNRDALDDALIRPGRVDMDEVFGPIADTAHAADLFNIMYGYRPVMPETLVGVSPAAMVGVCKSHMRDPETALRLLGELRPDHVVG